MSGEYPERGGPFEYDDKPGEECGVVAIYAPGKSGPRPTLAENTVLALGNLQHRGQDCAGVAGGAGNRIMAVGALGLVEKALHAGEDVRGLDGDFSLAHVRYATSYMKQGKTKAEKEAIRRLAIQPMLRSTLNGNQFALAYNGHIANVADLITELTSERGPLTKSEEVTDTAVMTSLISHRVNDGASMPDALLSVAQQINGAYSIAMWGKEHGEDKLWALRDPHGFRPLVLGSLPNGGWMVASEVGALGIVGAEFVEEIKPGHLVEISRQGVEVSSIFPSMDRECIFEGIYLQRPDGLIKGQRVERFRVASGHQLAKEHPTNRAEVVVGVPESALSAARGYARESGLPEEDAFVRNRYNPARSFIESSTLSREDKIRLKISSVLSENVEDKVVVLVEDSLVRGNTLRILVALLKTQGKAKEVHLRIASPRIEGPCFYGVDMPTRDELIAAHHTDEEIRNILGADSLAYLSVDGMYKAAGIVDGAARALGGAACGFCDACMTGDYPTDVSRSSR